VGKKADILARFGARVRELRKSRGLSQEEFAERCGLGRTYTSSIERAQRNVALRNIESIAAALNVTISDLLDGI
jgi:transcriptional regulator with XRE-family HTH domain